MNEPRSHRGARSSAGCPGALFFGGLWWTVRRALTAAIPPLGLGSACCCEWRSSVGLLLRCAVWMAGLLLCLGGLLVARVAMFASDPGA